MTTEVGSTPRKILVVVVCGVMSLWTMNLAVLQLSGTREVASGATAGPDTLAMIQGVSGLVGSLALIVGTLLVFRGRRSALSARVS